jgi:signal transduction histidine kinase
MMIVHDNGIGFDVRAALRGLGLLSMRERIDQVGGTLQLRSERGQGTQIEVAVPCGAAGTLEARAV